MEITLRPDDIRFEPQTDAECSVAARHFRGAMNIYELQLPSGQQLLAMDNHISNIAPGTPVKVMIDPGHDLVVFPL